MIPELSQRLGSVSSVLYQLAPDVREYIIRTCEDVQSLDAIPMDVDMWLAGAEAAVGAHPSVRDGLIREEAQIDEELP